MAAKLKYQYKKDGKGVTLTDLDPNNLDHFLQARKSIEDNFPNKVSIEYQNAIDGLSHLWHKNSAIPVSGNPLYTNEIVRNGITPIGTHPLLLTKVSPTMPLAKSLSNPAVDQSAQSELYAKEAADFEKLKDAKAFADTKSVRTRGILDMVNAGVGGAYGLAQMIMGRKASKKLHAPKRPNELLPNQQLSTALAQAQVDSQEADPKIREQAIRDIVSNREMANEAARVASAGDVTSYSQNAQNNYLKSNDSVRKLALDEQDDIFKKRQLVQGLLGMKMNEDRNAQNERMDLYKNVDLPEYANQRAYAAALSNQGATNLFGAINKGVNDSSILSGYKNLMDGFSMRYNNMTPDQQAQMRLKFPQTVARLDAQKAAQQKKANVLLNQNNPTATNSTTPTNTYSLPGYMPFQIPAPLTETPLQF